MKDQMTDEHHTTPEISRRKALARLGLAAGIAYTAPTIVHLDRSANATVLPTGCFGGDGKTKCPKGKG